MRALWALQALSDMIAEQGEAIEEGRWGLEYTLAVQSALRMNSENCEDVSNGM